MRIVVIAFVILSNGYSFGQEGELFQISPEWELKDKKTITTKTKSTIYVADTLFSETSIDASYTVEVIKSDKEKYVLSYKQQSTDFEMESIIGGEENVMQGMIQEILENWSEFEFKVFVSKETGLAYDLAWKDKLRGMMSEMVEEMIVGLGKEMGKSEEEIDEVNKMVKSHFKESEAEMFQTIVNGVNILLQPYSFSFPLDETYTQDIMAYDPNAMGRFGTTEFPARLTIYSEEEGNLLTINSSTEYDKLFLLERMEERSQSVHDLTVDDIEISEEETTVFNLDDTWIERSESKTSFVMPGVKVVQNTQVVFN